MNDPETLELLAETMELAACLQMESGGETYRVEECCQRMGRAAGMMKTQALAYPTGVILSIGSDGREKRIVVRRIQKRSIDLARIHAVNHACRAYADGRRTLEDTRRRLLRIKKSPGLTWYAKACYTGVSSGFFTLLIDGGWFDFAAAVMGGACMALLATVLERRSFGQILTHLSISLLGGLMALGIVYISQRGAPDKIIMGSIMPFLPGLAMTAAIREMMNRDLLSGLANMAEALLLSVSLASGAGIAWTVYFWFIPM